MLDTLKDMIRARTNWDEPPELGFVYRTGAKTIRVSALRLPLSVWRRAGNPTNALRFLHHVLMEPDTQTRPFAEMMRDNAPRELCALYMRTEGWGPPPDQVVELYNRRKAGGSTPRFETLPDRREIRMCGAADTTGRRYMVMQERTDSRVIGSYDGINDQDHIGGDQPELLAGVLAMLTGAPTPGEQPQDAR